MAEALTIARPYAEAAFRIARESGELANWGDALARIAALVGNETVRNLITNPSVSAQVVSELLNEGTGGLSDPQQRFILTLAENDRLPVMPEINEHFTRLRHAEEGSIDAHVSSAFEVTDEQRGQIVATLEAKYGRKVNVEISVDPELIGGVSVRVGDEVMDASVRGKLQRMASALKV